MSQYLVFKKGNQELCSFCRSSDVYRSFELPYTENWTELKEDDFNVAISCLEDRKKGYEEDIRLYKKALEGLSYEDKLECLRDIKEANEELNNIVQALHYIQLLQIIAEEYDTNNTQQTMYYRIA